MKQRPRLIDNLLVEQYKSLGKRALNLKRAQVPTTNILHTQLVSQAKRVPNVIPVQTVQSFPTQAASITTLYAPTWNADFTAGFIHLYDIPSDSWTTIDNPDFDYVPTYKNAVSGIKPVFIGVDLSNYNVLWHSDDKGQSWIKSLTQFYGIFEYTINSNDRILSIIDTPSFVPKLQRTDDYGDTWDDIINPLQAYGANTGHGFVVGTPTNKSDDPLKFALPISNGHDLLADDFVTSVFISVDGGLTATQLLLADTGQQNLSALFWQTSNRLIAILSLDNPQITKCFYSDNEGSSWTDAGWTISNSDFDTFVGGTLTRTWAKSKNEHIFLVIYNNPSPQIDYNYHILHVQPDGLSFSVIDVPSASLTNEIRICCVEDILYATDGLTFYKYENIEEETGTWITLASPPTEIRDFDKVPV